MVLTAFNLSAIDERNQERWLLIHYLRVFNAKDHELLGHLVNVTTEGILMISETPLSTGKDYQLKMAIPLDDGKTADIELQARAIWTKVDEDPHFHKTGLRFTHCSEPSLQAISALIKKLQQLQTPKYDPPEIEE